ncbi:MmcQ/YjbR family DNA-binding protein [Faecalibacter macacae]|uniref:MmcQ/YjbR family DNA-binding protein n=1 Tax=Faecalibacter macacae TaxID=1859289 RepID=A0A3L9M4N8_9FLAO|nr:MmcQ/YjbR family DNA-binding protein [Faecalibacter macacae]RLZ07792.1 MmcQ/YjbR family DNA-binding protein [Faecalibacter macacae]
MNIEELRDFCLSLPLVEEKFPFDQETLVFYIAGKMFCLADINQFDSVNIKCDPEKAIELREKYQAVLSGYHMNKKHWNTVMINQDVKDSSIKEWIKDSYNLVILTLPKSKRPDLI